MPLPTFAITKMAALTSATHEANASELPMTVCRSKGNADWDYLEATSPRVDQVRRNGGEMAVTVLPKTYFR